MEEHRKMVRSAPCSPDPSSAWKNPKGQTKNTQENSNLLHLPQVKCLQNLSQMSPKLRKVFNIRNKRSKSKNNERPSSDDNYANDQEKATGSFKRDTSAAERRRSFQIDHGKTFPMASLDVIQEKDHSDISDCDQSDKETKEKGNFNLAKAVLNLIRSQKQAEYMSVQAEDTDNETQDSSNKVTDNKSKDKTDSTSAPVRNKQGSLKSVTRRRYNSLNQKKDENSDEQDSKKKCIRKHHSVDSQESNSNKLPLPKIVLTNETKPISSSSSSDSDTDVEDTIPIRPSKRDSFSRKSSPCVLSLPSAFTDRLNRRISLPPPLDLPIEVPKFSNFRGLSRNESDVSHSLDRFKDTVERRMDDLENSYKETMTRLEETTKMQEKFMRTIIKKLSSGKDKVKDRAEYNMYTDKEGKTTEHCSKRVDELANKPAQTRTSESLPHSSKDLDTEPGDDSNINQKHQCDSSGSSTEDHVTTSYTYANNPVSENVQHSSFDSSRQSSIDSLQRRALNGVRQPESFRILEDIHPGVSNTTDNDAEFSDGMDYQIDDIRVTHL